MLILNYIYLDAKKVLFLWQNFFKMKRTTTLLHTLLVAAMFSFAQGQAQKAPLVFGKALAPESINPENGYVRCISNEYEKHLQSTDTSRMTDAQFEAWIAPFVEKYKTDPVYRSENAGIITIPVVVHVIHSGQAIGVAPNITDSQALSQITAMNNDYRRMAGTRGANSSPVGADTMIQFALAKSDPDGNPTNGVNHVNLCQDSWSTTEINTIVKPSTIWDPMQYLNMWSVPFSDSSLLGYAQFPSGSGLPGLQPNGGSANSDGVVSNYATFGSTDFDDGTFLMNAPYDKGRTMTHEVGHWLGLRHIWGDSSCGDDYCDDTPIAHTANYTCNVSKPACAPSTGFEMVRNYMDYTNDTCMNIFTQDQKARMIAVMNNSIRRVTLKSSTKDQPVALFANDAKLKLDESCTPVPNCDNDPIGAKAYLTNSGTATITSATISYTFNNGTPQTFNFTGSIAPTMTQVVLLPFEATDSGIVNATIINVNGVADQRATNNASEGIYILPTSPTAYAVDKVEFKLKRDNYGTETTWNLKNAAGATLYSGGPYNNGSSSVLTETWTLPADGCYTFTINDSYGDGMLSPGYYNIKTLAGVTIAAGGQFGSKETKVFATAEALGTNSFDAANSIQLYPNPTKSNMTISVSNAAETPESYSIYNTIGQQIASQKITSNSDLTINTSALSAGVYFIKLAKGSATKTLRFIKE